MSLDVQQKGPRVFSNMLCQSAFCDYTKTPKAEYASRQRVCFAHRVKGESPNCTELVLSRAAWAASLHGRDHCEACVRGQNPRQDRKLEPSSERSHNLLPPH